MIFLLILIIAIQLILMIKSRHENVDYYEKSSMLQKCFLKVSVYLSGQIPEKFQISKNKEISSTVKKLYPLKSDQDLYQKQIIEKRSLQLMILFIGSFISLFLSMYEKTNLEELHFLQRNRAGNGGRLEELKYELEDLLQGELQLFLTEEIYTKEEIEGLFQEFLPVLERTMLNENKSRNRVTSDLKFLEKIPNYPFFLEWRSKNYRYIAYDGSLDELDPGVNQQLVTIQCLISYMEYEWIQEYTVQLEKPERSVEEEVQDSILSQLQTTEKETQYENKMELPGTFGKETIHWYRKTSYGSYVGILITVIGIISSGYLKEKERKKYTQKKLEYLKHEYGVFVSKLSLYLTAGLSIRASLLRLCEDYEKKKKSEEFLYEELLLLTRELETGTPLKTALQEFGKRCRDSNYIKLSGLLLQNEKNGNRDILERLYEESFSVFEERIRHAKKLGEEASTKLLFPMMILLVVLMVMIMIPAFMNFNT